MRKVVTERLGGTEGNEILTNAAAVVLTILLLAEGLTILRMGSLRTAHMFVGMLLIPPVLLKLGSTGYRFMRYYAGTRAYRDKGPPPTLLRLLAPLLVLMTLAVFATGVALLLLGHRSDLLVQGHKVSFILWGGLFALHFLAHAPKVLRSLSSDWTASRRRRVGGAGLRGALVSASLAGGVALAIGLLSLMTGWHGGFTGPG